MEGAKECDHQLSASVIARQLQRTLDRLRAGVAVVNAVRPRHGRDLRYTLSERDQALVIKVGA